MPMVAGKGPYTLFILDDEDADSPRLSDDNFGTMVCFHKRYNLGDKHDYSEPDDFLRDVARENVSVQDIIDYAKSSKSDKMKFEYNKSSKEWELSTFDVYYKKWYAESTFAAPIKGQEGLISDAITECMRRSDLHNIIDGKVAILPLYLYDHSGITMNTSGFSCPWDSGQVGWIYASKDDMLKEFNVSEITPELIEKSINILQGNVEYYDNFIRGNCYGFKLYKDDEEIDSCWGFIGDSSDIEKSIEDYMPDECKGITNNLQYRHDSPDIEDFLLEQSQGMEAI